MTTIQQTLARFEHWRRPARAGGAGAFLVRCVVDPPADLKEINETFAGMPPLKEAVEFWNAARTARLFENVEFGQWGLLLLSPAAAATRTAAERRLRHDDYAQGDVVIGEFLGDQDLLIVSRASGILVSSPLDQLGDWPRVAADLAEFPERYADSEGAKYWE